MVVLQKSHINVGRGVQRSSTVQHALLDNLQANTSTMRRYGNRAIRCFDHVFRSRRITAQGDTMNKLALSRNELDALIADVARRAPHVLPILRKVRAGEIACLELTRSHSRVLRLGPPGHLPSPAPRGRGPSAFPRRSPASPALLRCRRGPAACGWAG